MTLTKGICSKFCLLIEQRLDFKTKEMELMKSHLGNPVERKLGQRFSTEVLGSLTVLSSLEFTASLGYVWISPMCGLWSATATPPVVFISLIQQ